MDDEAILDMVRRRLSSVADPDRAASMGAYLKTDMPIYGVGRPDLKPILRDLVARARPDTVADYRDATRLLWGQPHREEKYLAIGFARASDRFVDARSLDLYADLIVEGAWWDLVDEVAIHLVGRALENDRVNATPTIREWVSSSDLWLRRTSIICQVTRGDGTDVGILSEACSSNLGDRDFFIRKAIGWALRDYSKVDPAWVRSFIDANRTEMSGLSLREASKYL